MTGSNTNQTGGQPQAAGGQGGMMQEGQQAYSDVQSGNYKGAFNDVQQMRGGNMGAASQTAAQPGQMGGAQPQAQGQQGGMGGNMMQTAEQDAEQGLRRDL